MSRTALTPLALSSAGVAQALVAADKTNGNSFPYNQNYVLDISNTSGGSVTVTIETSLVVSGLDLPDQTYAVPNNGRIFFSNWNAKAFEQSDSNVYLDYSAPGLMVEVLDPTT